MVAAAQFDAEAFFNSDTPASQWLEETFAEVDPVELVLKIRDTLGRKFEVTDITHNGSEGTMLYEIAEEWLPTQVEADFDWLRDLARKYTRGGGLTDGQAKGVLNCLYAAESRKRRFPISVALPPKAKTLEMDADIFAEIQAADAYRDFCASAVAKGHYTVQWGDNEYRTIKISDWKDDNRRPGKRVRWIGFLSGSNNESNYTTFARQDCAGVLHMMGAYAQNTLLKAAAEVVLYGTTEERAEMREAYAQESGRCAICNRRLTVPASLNRGLGPECATRGGL